jgi:hypothetical protein
MTGLADGCAGLALAMGFAMLGLRQPRAVFWCLAAQAAFVAAAALFGQDPLLAAPPVVTMAVIWMVRQHPAVSASAAAGATRPGATGATRPGATGVTIAGIGLGLLLAVLCQYQGDIGLPLAVTLLAVVLAAIRRQPVLQLMALGAMQNGLVLMASFVGWDGVLPLACLALPLPLAATLAADARGLIARAWRESPRHGASWPGWITFAACTGLLAATLTVPLDALASVFAPLLAFDGMVQAWIERKDTAIPATARLTLLLRLGFVLLAVGTTQPVLAWLAVLTAAATTLVPGGRARQDHAVLAYVAAGLALLGLLLLADAPSAVAFLGLFAGYAGLAAVVPDLGMPLLALLLRFADGTDWPPVAGTLGMGIALAALLGCAVLLLRAGRPHRAVLLQLGQASLVALAIATMQPEGRYAAAILLILLILTRAACRAGNGPAGVLALAGMAGLPPLGVFPGVVLVVLVISSHAPWALLPVVAALVPMLLAGLPRRLRLLPLQPAVLSVGWLPLALALAFGFFAPSDLIRWLSALTAGSP